MGEKTQWGKLIGGDCQNGPEGQTHRVEKERWMNLGTDSFVNTKDKGMY